MSVISVNGADLPGPTEYRIDETPIGKFDRNANGRLVGDLIGIKTRIIAGWKMMSDADFLVLMNAARAHFVELSFYDPAAAMIVVKKMAVNARTGRLAVFEEKGKWWADVSAEFVEV